MPTYGDELLEALASPIEAGLIKVVSEGPVAAGLEAAFPFSGSKIDWSAVAGHDRAVETHPNEHTDFLEFFARHARRLGAGNEAFYLCDGPWDFVLSATLFTFERHLPLFITVPAHHYFISQDFSWCMVYTMEGDIDFGRSLFSA